MVTSFPSEARTAAEVLAEVTRRTVGDLDWRSGRAFSLVYHADDEDLSSLQHEVASRFLHENALNPFAYPSLRTMEREVVGFAADLLHGEPKAGSLSSGGTESIFLAVQVARDHARSNGVEHPEILVPATAHPAFAKATHYLGVREHRIPVGSDLRADPDATADAMTEQTVLVVGSAPCYPYGLIDPIPELATIANERDVLCHVDACLGGWLLPFWESTGGQVEPWDFRVPGVTSISADVHKYGWCFKGASVLLHRDPDLKSLQHFIFDDWPGGLYGSATTAGTRAAAPIAGAWATISFLGREGYEAKATILRQATQIFITGIEEIDGLAVTGDPAMSVFEFRAEAGDATTTAIGDAMRDAGWQLDQQGSGLHLMLSPVHHRVAEEFLADLRTAVEGANGGPTATELGAVTGEAAPYSGIA